MKTYNSLKEIELDLKKMKLEKQILVEEIKLSVQKIDDNFSSNIIMSTLLPIVKKFGIPYLIHRIFK